MTERRSSRFSLVGLSLRGLDELSLFPDDGTRRSAVAQIERETRWWHVAAGSVVVVTAQLAIYLPLRTLVRSNWPAAPSWIRDDLILVISIAAGFLALRALHRWGAAKSLRRKLIDAGIPVCLACGYSLAGLDDSITHCPECGADISGDARLLLGDRQSTTSDF